MIYRIQNTGLQETKHMIYRIQNTGYIEYRTQDIQDTEHKINRICRIQNTGFTGYKTHDIQDSTVNLKNLLQNICLVNHVCIMECRGS